MNTKNPGIYSQFFMCQGIVGKKKTEQIPGKLESQACSMSSMELNPTHLFSLISPYLLFQKQR